LRLFFWNIAGDLEQILLRGGLTYKATDQALLTLGYGNITTGAYGDSDDTFNESRIYQEVLLGHKISKWVRLKHRFRYEQRWASDTDFRTRYRYNLFMTIPLTQKLLAKGGLYLSFYNELFISGIRSEGAPVFDRNRFYGAVGYAIHNNHKVQLGIMQQSTNNWTKNQLQLSVHSTL